MAHILVVGATGQLGTRCVETALAAGHRVRALVRPGSRHAHLLREGIECVAGDLRDADSLVAACRGIDAVLATATVVFPRGRYSFAQDEGRGYGNLLNACRQSAVGRFLFVSIAMPFTPNYLARVPTLRMKARCEAMLEDSPLDYTVFRCTPFMDDYFALMGSRLPLRGEVAATLDRASGLTSALRALFGASIERWGLATVPGPEHHRHAFIAVEDVARCMVDAIDDPATHRRTIELTGPEEASWSEVAALYAGIFGRRVRVLSLPAWMLRTCAWLARPWSEAAANQLRLLQVLAEQQTRARARAGSPLAMRATSPSAYLAAKARSQGGR